jgi:hypothetical protein
VDKLNLSFGWLVQTTLAPTIKHTNVVFIRSSILFSLLPDPCHARVTFSLGYVIGF